MIRDPIVEEVRRVRQEHASKFGYDLEAIFRDLRRSERSSGVKTVTLRPRVRLRRAQ